MSKFSNTISIFMDITDHSKHKQAWIGLSIASMKSDWKMGKSSFPNWLPMVANIGQSMLVYA